jgi:hypothetical protein
MVNLTGMSTRDSWGGHRTLMLIALLLVVCANAIAGCSSGTVDPAGAGGTGGSGGSGSAGGIGGSGGSGGAGNPSACAGTVNGSCRRNNGIDCADYTDLSASMMQTIELACGNDNIGTWTAGSACDRSGALGGCREMLGTACQVYWTYTGSAADAMSECAGDMGTWVNP